jgi:EpsI family protein
VRIGWRLGVILILFAATAGILHLAPPVTGAMNPVSVYAVPSRLGQWSGTDGVPDEILPSDPNEKVSMRRTYRHGDRVAWITVALFVGQDDAIRRGSINKIYPQRSVSRIEPLSFTVALNGSATSSISLPAVIIHQDSRRLLVAYWHQIGNRVYGSEYRFRFAMMRDMVSARRADSLLVRIATPAGPEPELAMDLDMVARLAAEMYPALAGDITR